VSVEVTLHARRTAPPDLAARAAAALARFYDPLRGGPDGTGWPFGRAVRAAEVLAALAAVGGVIYADGLRLGPAAECDAIAVCPTELVNLLPPRIAVAWE
jgi:hypothetical protein